MFDNLEIFSLIALVVFAVSALVQLIYYWGIFARLAFFKNKVGEQHLKPPVSVVIAARNEYHNLSKNLENILTQDYPDFEVVVVNHASTDETKYYLEEMKGKFPHLKTVQIDRDLNFFSGKKFPLSIGIKSAKNDILLLTDADCSPASNKWIANMAANYSHASTEVVLGYGPYKKTKGFVNLLIRYDSFLVAMQYLSFALTGLPYMGVGRNLSYRKSLFLKNKGFISHYKIPSGDDDLFINAVATRKNCRIEISPETFVQSQAKITFKEWSQQKRRHLSTGTAYKTKFKFLIGLFSVSQLLFFISFVILLLQFTLPEIVIPVFFLRFFTQFIVNKKTSDKFQEGRLYLFSPLLEILYLIIMPVFGLFSLMGKKVSWK